MAGLVGPLRDSLVELHVDEPLWNAVVLNQQLLNNGVAVALQLDVSVVGGCRCRTHLGTTEPKSKFGR